MVSPPCPRFSHAFAQGLAVGDLIDRSAMTGGEKGVELVASWCERKRVRTLFRRNAPELLHRFCVEDVYDAWVPNGHVEAVACAIEEHDIGGAAQRILAQDLSRTRIES